MKRQCSHPGEDILGVVLFGRGRGLAIRNEPRYTPCAGRYLGGATVVLFAEGWRWPPCHKGFRSDFATAHLPSMVCPRSSSEPRCIWCETDKLISDCLGLKPTVEEYCHTCGKVEYFAICRHIGGECQRCLSMVLGMCRVALLGCQLPPRELAPEDVSQTLFFRILKSNWDPGKSPLSGWMGVIIRRIVADARKAAYGRRTRTVGGQPLNNVEGAGEDIRADETRNDPAALAAQRDLRRRVHQAVASLPFEVRQLVTLRFIEGHTLQSIAKELAMPLSTVARKLQKALNNLEGILGDWPGAAKSPPGGAP